MDLEEVRSFRFAPSRGVQAVQNTPYQRIEADISISAPSDKVDISLKPTPTIDVRYHTPEEEIALGPACWLWDYLRRCGGVSGYFLPLSGGIDSCATATIVYSMCSLVLEACENGGVFFPQRWEYLRLIQVIVARGASNQRCTKGVRRTGGIYLGSRDAAGARWEDIPHILHGYQEF